MPESLTVVAEQAVLGGRPQEARAVLEQDLDCQVGEAILSSEIAEDVLLALDGGGARRPDQEGNATQHGLAPGQSHI